jgi:phenylpropionate dioxygenase-like ring-hydroxylating dioxygenase large terminal subunit
MGLIRAWKTFWGGYPGGWKSYARGMQGERTPPFVPTESPTDSRYGIPPKGLREYWYPALPAKAVGWKKPVALRIVSTDLVFFRDADGEVRALWDYCPHRGVYLSWGHCVWKGFVSCPYHGATFNGEGECVEFITEGPDSKMVGALKARSFPTRTLKGIVFVWMGEGEPVAIEEDVPPEFFEGADSLVQHTFRYWPCNWMIALENTYDSHNCFWVHRNAMAQLRSRSGGRPRTPLGYQGKMVENKAVIAQPGAEQYYFKEGRVPYQMYYPRVNGYWPKTRWRLLWTWFFEWRDRQNKRKPRFDTPEEWRGARLPGMQRLFFFGPGAMYTRWCVPVDEDLTRVVYFRSKRIASRLGRWYEIVTFHLYRNWMLHYNFSDMDYDAMRSVRYQYPEYLSATDNYMVMLRWLIREQARDLKRARRTSPAAASADALTVDGD